MVLGGQQVAVGLAALDEVVGPDPGELSFSMQISAAGGPAGPASSAWEAPVGRTVAQAWAAWLDVLEAHGFAARAMTRPDAAEAELAQVAGRGVALPEELLVLYRLSDGQRDGWPPRELDGHVSTDLFPLYRFLPCALAATEWQRWNDLADQEGPSGMADHAEHVTVPEPGKVAKEYWIPGWWPLARDGGGNLLAVDTAPPAAGSAGQIIVMGPDEDQRRVLATGVGAYLAALAASTLELHHAPEGRLTWDLPALR